MPGAASTWATVIRRRQPTEGGALRPRLSRVTSKLPADKEWMLLAPAITESAQGEDNEHDQDQ